MVRRIILMTAASLSFAVMSVLVREADGTDILWKVLFRNAVVVVIILASTPPLKWKSLIGKKETRFLLVVRGLAGTMGILGYFIGIAYLPLANASILNRLNPFFVAIFALIFIGQKLKPVHVVSLIAAFIGAAMVVNPGGGYPLWPTAAALASAAFAGLAYTMIRLIGDREESTTIMMYFAAMSFIATVPLLVFWQPVIALSDLPYLLGIGVFAALGQYLLTLSYRGGHAATVSAFGYTNVVFSAVLGFMLYQEQGSAVFYAGAVIIFLSLILLYAKGGKE